MGCPILIVAERINYYKNCLRNTKVRVTSARGAHLRRNPPGRRGAAVGPRFFAIPSSQNLGLVRVDQWASLPNALSVGRSAAPAGPFWTYS